MAEAVIREAEGAPTPPLKIKPHWSRRLAGEVATLLVAVMILLSAFAGREFRLKEVLILMVVLIVGCWALFIKGLELPFPLFWWR